MGKEDIFFATLLSTILFSLFFFSLQRENEIDLLESQTNLEVDTNQRTQ